MFSGSINSEDRLAGGDAGTGDRGGGGSGMCSITKLHLQPLDFTNSILLYSSG